MDEELVRSYLAAFRAANPDKPDPKITYRSGWYKVTSIGSFAASTSKWRKSEMEAARDRLIQRATDQERAENE